MIYRNILYTIKCDKCSSEQYVMLDKLKSIGYIDTVESVKSYFTENYGWSTISETDSTGVSITNDLCPNCSKVN